MTSWVSSCRDVSIDRIAGELGIDLRTCPVCETKRMRTFQSDRGGERWHCHNGPCQSKGDVIDLVAVVVTGDALPRGKSDASSQVRGWFASRGWCEPPRESFRPVQTRNVPRTPRPGAKTQNKAPPPREDVARFLKSCRPVTEDPEVSAWVERRLGAVTLRPGLVGALPKDVPLPDWAMFGRRSWVHLGYRVVFPMYDVAGDARSVRVRHVTKPEDGSPKTLPPRGYGLTGLIMADPLARLLLKTGKRPDWWPVARPFRVIVAEGEPAFLAWCAAMQGAAAVFGIISGSWTEEIGARVPDRSYVTIATDRNDKYKTGDKYAEKIAKTLVDRCALTRWSPSL